MSNFTFDHNVFKSRLLLLRQNASAGGKGLKDIDIKPIIILFLFDLVYYSFQQYLSYIMATVQNE